MYGYQAKSFYVAIMLALCLMFSKTYYAQNYALCLPDCLGLVLAQSNKFLSESFGDWNILF